MPGPIPVERRQVAVEAYLSGGRSAAKVAADYGVSVPSLRRWISAHRRGDGLTPRPMGGARRPRYFDDAGEQVLRELVEESPDASLSELAAAATQRLGGQVSDTTVWRALERMGFERVRPERVATPAAEDEDYRYRDVHRREGTATSYPTDLTDAEWDVLAPVFEGRFRGGREPVHSNREMLDAMFYVVRTGCAWRMLPKDFPPWQAVYARFRRWTDSGFLEEIHDGLRRMWRLRVGRTAEPSAGIIDSQSVKTTEKGGPRGFDGAKKSEGPQAALAR